MKRILLLALCLLVAVAALSDAAWAGEAKAPRSPQVYLPQIKNTVGGTLVLTLCASLAGGSLAMMLLVSATSPRFMRVTAVFNVRGGVYTEVIAEHRAEGWMAATPVELH